MKEKFTVKIKDLKEIKENLPEYLKTRIINKGEVIEIENYEKN